MCIAPNNKANGALVHQAHHQQMCHSTDDLIPGSLSSSVTKSTKSRVSFNGSVLVYPHLHFRNFTETEVSSSWYSVEEIDAIKAECNHTVNLSIQGKLRPNVNSCLCFRGLEFRTPEGARSRRYNKYLAWDQVIGEQENQYNLGIFDAEEIARTYSKVSFACQESAHVLALEDARLVVEMRLLSDIAAWGKTAISESSSSSPESSSPNKRRRRTIFNIPITFRTYNDVAC